MIEIRKQNPAFGLGSYTELPSSNPAVLAFLRESLPNGDDLVLCVHNFSRFAQPTELDLRAFNGRHPVELIGGVRFPAIGELPYLLTLAGHGFYWFRLARVASAHSARRPLSVRPGERTRHHVEDRISPPERARRRAAADLARPGCCASGCRGSAGSRARTGPSRTWTCCR